MNKKEILKNLCERNGVDSIKEIVPAMSLSIEQQTAVVFSLVQKKLIISLDTGLGKTVVSCALLNLVLTKNDKALFILKRGTLDELYKKITSGLREGLYCGFITSERHIRNKMIERQEADMCNVLVISSDAICEADVNDYLYRNKDSFKAVIIDEMHMFSNLKSVESRLMYLLVKHSEYTFTLTATPFERDISQLINTVSMLQPHLFGEFTVRQVYNKFSYKEEDGTIKYKDLDKLKKICKTAVFNVTRPSMGIEVKKECNAHFIKPEYGWDKLSGTEATITFKGDITKQPFFKLCEILNMYKMMRKRGLVYINLNDIKKPVLDRLREVGFKVGIIDGSIATKKDIQKYKRQFKEGDLDCIIINTATSLDLECDFIIFYEMTLSYIQMLGRINRSREYKECFIDFIIVKDTVEEKFFKQNVYQRVHLLNQMYNKGGEELNKIMNEIRG